MEEVTIREVTSKEKVCKLWNLESKELHKESHCAAAATQSRKSSDIYIYVFY